MSTSVRQNSSSLLRHAQGTRRRCSRLPRVKPLAAAIAVLAMSSSLAAPHAHAQARPFSSGWMAAKGAAHAQATATGRLPNGMLAGISSAAQQQQQAQQKLSRSVANLGSAAAAIAAQQAAQAAARAAAQNDPSVPEGLAEGGLKIDGARPLSEAWVNAKAPVQTQADGRINVAIEQTKDKAILNWETFNVGQNTTVDFKQQADWAVLNRVNDPQARPSQIQGQIKGGGTVMIANANGVVFSGTSQVNVRNLVAAAAKISDAQFTSDGLYGKNNVATFTQAGGKVEVQAGAQIATHEASSVTRGGGYVLLMGSEVSNAGTITTRKGQAQLAAGDAFIIRKGVGTDGNTASTTRGNEVAPQFNVDSTAGKVSNSGLILAREGDITLAGRDVRQNGVAVSTTTVNQRGTVHLLNSAADTSGKVSLAQGAVTAVLIEDDGKTTALDSQRDALIKESGEQDLLRSKSASGVFDNLSILADRRDQSRIEIVSGGNIVFEGDSLTLATGGQIVTSAARRSFVADRAQLDVSGAVGVQVAMESNNVKVNVQGFELRDAPLNRDSGKLFNNDVWIDRRQLVLVPKGTGGYESDRWYTSNGLLEVGGYLGTQGHSIGEWAAQGGTVLLGGSEVITQVGSAVNLAGGTLDVATGYLNQSWLRGSDGRLYSLDKAPADMVFGGVYKGYEAHHARWDITETFYNPMIGPRKRLENGYTVGRDAGQLILSTPTSIFEGNILADVVQGTWQNITRPDGVADGYKIGQNIVAQAGKLLVGAYGSLGRIDVHDTKIVIGDIANITVGLDASSIFPTSRTGTVYLDATHLNDQKLGGLDLATGTISGSATHGTITIESDLVLADGGFINLTAPTIDIAANVSVRSGSVTASNQLTTREVRGRTIFTRTTDLGGTASSVTLRGGATIDIRGVWTNALLDPANLHGLAFIDGGDVTLRSTGDVNLEDGSKIDTSAGGAILASGKTRNGQGGNLSLLAGYNGGSGNLTLSGLLAGYGGKGGALSLSTSGFVVIGDANYQIGSTLPAGAVTPADVTLTEALFIPAGTPLPATYHRNITRLEPGTVLPTDIAVPANVMLAANWLVPEGVINVFYTYSGSTQQALPGATVPAGATLIAANYANTRSLPVGYVLPADVFPSGLTLLQPITVPYKPGTPAPAGGVTLAAGTRIPAGTLLPMRARINPLPTLHIADDFLSHGFSKYSINGQAGLLVTEGAVVAPVMPVYQFTANTSNTPTGRDPAAALSLWLPDVYTPDRVNATFIQRVGVDLELLSGRISLGSDFLSGGGITIGAGASITVDHGQGIEIASGGQVTVDGSITAHSGEIAILNRGMRETEDPGGLSIWIGQQARLDASAKAVTATDAQGRPYGVMLDGGAVILGSRGGDGNETNAYKSTEAFVVLREGSVIDVSGTSAELDFFTLGPSGQSTVTRRAVASSGGSIVLASYQGIYNDGTLLGRAGGAGASGGTLMIALEAPIYGLPANEAKSSRIMGGRTLHIAQAKQASRLLGDLTIGYASTDLKPGYANLSADEVAAGGFDSLSLFARTAIVFDGEANLAAGRRITLRTSGLYQSVANAHASVAAPYVTLDGELLVVADQGNVLAARMPDWPTTGSITVQGHSVDVANRMNAHVDKLTLDAVDDLRFSAYNRTKLDIPFASWTMLAAVGDLNLIAQRIYPATDAKVQLYAGTAIHVDGSPTLNINATANKGTVTLGRHGDGDVATPYSVFGRLDIEAGTIRQGSNLFAPFGSLTLTARTPGTVVQQTRADQGLVEFLPGSLTSVSAKGLVIPYGGTADGVSYTVNGDAPLPYDLFGGTIIKDVNRNYINSDSGQIGITVTAGNVVGHEGAVLDLSGGGTLAGAAFVSGRGGSVDVLVNPLVVANPRNTYSSSGNKVYAIVPGLDVAPASGSYFSAWTGTVSSAGERITIPGGVPGLPAGTYTLLPANYALLPGAYRVELSASGTTGLASAVTLPNGSYVTSATRSVAHTGISDALFTSAIVTPGTAVRTYSQYSEQDYAAFQSARAATFGSVRPLLPVDSKFLTINLSTLAAGSAGRIESALRFDGEALFAPAQGGYGGTLAIQPYSLNPGSYQMDLAITGESSTTARTVDVITVAASDIAKFDAPNLYLGGGPSNSLRTLTLESGVALTGSQVTLSAADLISVRSGASINTLGRGRWTPDFVDTGYLTSSSNAQIVVSNGSVVLQPSSSTSGSVVLEDGSSLYSEGSIAFAAGEGVDLRDGVRFGTRDFELVSSHINIGTAASLAAARAGGVLPGGLSLDQTLFDRLLRSDPVTGAPGMKNLILSAVNSVNFYGSVNLSTLDAGGKSLLDNFVLSTPAMYGHGGWNDTVTLATDRLVWSSRSVYTSWTDEQVSAVPGAIITGGPGTGNAVFNVAAREILFGYPAHSQPQKTVRFDRLMLGFGAVKLNASERITSNNINTLSVWRSGPNPTDLRDPNNPAAVLPFDPATYRGDAAVGLTLVTPLLTGDSASILSIYAGGGIGIWAPAGAAPADTSGIDTLGATINLTSFYGGIGIDTAVALPSGKLTAKTYTGVQINAGARIDLSGRAIAFNDVTKYSWGGDIYLESGLHGSIVVLDGATFDVSAVNNHAGSITLVSPEPFDGGDIALVGETLDGMFKGNSTEGYNSGSFKLSAYHIGPLKTGTGSQNESFARINRALNAGGFFGTRDFAIKKGNLAIGDEVKAHNVIVSVDNGSLTVNGRINASGAKPGSIRLSSAGDLTLASTAVLDTHGTVLQTDSYGAPVEAMNRGTIELTTTNWLSLHGGATLDLTSPDGLSRGQVVLNAGRVQEIGSGDIRIDAPGTIDIRGAGGIALNAFWSYSPRDANRSIVQDNGSSSPVNMAGELGLKQIDALNTAFINAALGNSALLGRISGLTAHRDAFHLRPGVEIVSGGDLTVKSDLDLSAYRYASLNPNTQKTSVYGSGEPLALVVRAARDLTIKGSISDGFSATSPTAPMLAPGSQSASIRLVGGADISSADTRALLPLSKQTYVASRVILDGLTDVPSSFDLFPGEDWGWGSPIDFYTSYGTYYFAQDWTVPNNAFYETIADWGYLTDTTGKSYAAGSTVPKGTAFKATDPATGGMWMFDSSASLPSLAATAIVEPAGYTGSVILSNPRPQPAYAGLSVIRTGTGNLDLLGSSDLVTRSPFGVYTAGTQIDVGSAYSGVISQGGYFTEGGGDVRIAAGRDLTGYIWQSDLSTGGGGGANNYAVSNWLVSQGDATTPAAWGIRFGAYFDTEFRGFSGFGSLGGGNLVVKAGHDAGVFEQITNIGSGTTYMSTGLALAVGSSGRIDGGSLMQTGGGHLSFEVGGRLNPLTAKNYDTKNDFYGSFTNVRGDIAVQAASIGNALLDYGFGSPNDPRAIDPWRATRLQHNGAVGGPVVVIGDGTANLQARGHLLLGGVGDPGTGSFTLWRPKSAIRLLSAGGNIVPLSGTESIGANERQIGNNTLLLPPIFEAAAPHGSLYWAGRAKIQLAPSRDGYLELLAGDSIYAAAFSIGRSSGPGAPTIWSVSGADPNSLANPFQPAANGALDVITTNLHKDDDKVIRVYARDGDIVNFTLGDPPIFIYGAWVMRYVAAMPARIMAGRDIVNFGRGGYQGFRVPSTPSLILNNDTTDVSIIQAGRDIWHADVQIAGPGTLEVTAGRNLYQGDKASINSIGPIAEGDTRPGASIAVLAGAGGSGPDWSSLASRYLYPANQADITLGSPLADQSGKVAKTYGKELTNWLKEHYGYEAGSASDALTYFNGLAPEQQRIFLRSVYYAELKAGGREYNDVNGPRLGSYLRGRQAIVALFPQKDAGGNSIERGGSYTAFGGSGIQTLFGGDIQVLAPAGQIVVGIEGVVPPASSGLITQGDGDIQLYSEGSMLLGLSRIMTTFGGDILAWSAKGDINAGRGSKTTLVYTPPKRVYDAYGNVTLSPDAPSSGAGIATLNPIPEVEPGDIDLIAPLGTIDAGEAGIRVSGNVNIAALHVVNAANIQVQGDSTGVPVAAVVNTGALTSASAASTSAATAAQESVSRARNEARQNQPSIFSVQILGFGGEGGSGGAAADRAGAAGSGIESQKVSYRPDDMVQVLGDGELAPRQAKRLSSDERRRLGL